MREQTCRFTGHRIIPANDQALIKKALEKTILSLTDSGYLQYIAGGALGVCG